MPQEKQKDTMIKEYERVDFVAVLYVVRSGRSPEKVVRTVTAGIVGEV